MTCGILGRIPVQASCSGIAPTVMPKSEAGVSLLRPHAAVSRRLFTPPPEEPFALTDLGAEVRLLDPGRVPGGLQVSRNQCSGFCP